MNESSAIDLWNGGLDKVFKKSPYFYHPIYFINHMEKAGLLEFNPYEKNENKTKLIVHPGYKISPKGVRYGSDGGTEVLNSDSALNNPGCAPFIVKNGKEDYASLVGIFNEDYLKVARYMNDGEPDLYENYRTKYHHFGVDFSAKKGTPVKSFIYGKVIAKGWISTDGRCLLIQRKSNNYLHLLCHLSGYPEKIKVGTDISPGEVIAFTGCSGATTKTCSETTFSSNSHLHLSVLKYDKKITIDDVVIEDLKTGTTEDTFSWNSNFILNYIDPFNYAIKWKGRVDIPGTN